MITTCHFPITERMTSLDWSSILQSLDDQGFAILPAVLTPHECLELIQLYTKEECFRSRVNMERYRFGRGEYQYFAYPLPDLVQSLRQEVFSRLVPLADRWNQALGINSLFPYPLDQFLHSCHQAGQTRPTPLLLKYEAGDYNCLHQDLYGNVTFPLQLAIVLSQPGRDYTGGEFVLTEQRPRAQSQVHVLSLQQGDGVIFAVNQRPVPGIRGIRRVSMRHGVSALHSGQRFCLGVIFHDAT